MVVWELTPGVHSCFRSETEFAMYMYILLKTTNFLIDLTKPSVCGEIIIYKSYTIHIQPPC